MRYSFLGMLGVCVTFFLLNSSAGWSVTVRWIIVGFYAVCILIQSGFPPAALAQLANISAQSAGRGATMGIYTLLLSLGNIIGALLGGFFASRFAFNGLLIVTLAMAIVGLYSLSRIDENIGMGSAETQPTLD